MVAVASERGYIVGNDLAGDVVVVVALLGQLVGAPARTRVEVSADRLGVVGQRVPYGRSESLGLAVVDERRNDGLNAQPLDRLVLQRSAAADLGAPCLGVAAAYEQTVGVGARFTLGDASVVPCGRIDGGHLAHHVERTEVRGDVLSAADVDVDRGEELVLDDGGVVVGAQHHALVLALAVETVDVVIGERHLRPHEVRTAADRDVVLVLEGRILHDQALPVGQRILVGIGLVVADPVLDLIRRVLLEKSGCGVVVVEQLVVHLHVTGHADHVGLHGGNLPAHLAVVGEVRPFLGAALGGDQDHAGSGLRTVDRGGGSVFQHRYALHVVGIDIVDVVAGASVDDNQRVVVAHGRDTAHLDRTRSARRTAVARHEQTRNRALQRRRKRGGLTCHQVVALDRRYRTRKVLLLDGAVADHHDLVHQFGVRLERDVQRSFPVVGTFIGLVADVRKDERDAFLHVHRVTTLGVGGRTVPAVLLENGDAEEGRSVLIADDSRHGQCLCGCNDREGTQRAKDKYEPAHLLC